MNAFKKTNSRPCLTKATPRGYLLYDIVFSAKHVFTLSVFPSTVMTEVLSPVHLMSPGDSVYVAWYERAGNTSNTPVWPSNGTAYTGKHRITMRQK